MFPKFPTPSTSHLDFSTIYEPAEDSFLFLDTLSSAAETTFLKLRFDTFASSPNQITRSSSPLVLEVGTGSGIILAFATAHAEHIFGRNDVLTMGVDVNEGACQCTAETVRIAVEDAQASPGNSAEGASVGLDEKSGAKALVSGSGIYLGNICSDLTTSLRPGSVDVLLFNPPYVPTEVLPDHTTSVKHRDRFGEESHLLALSYAGGVDGMEVTERLLGQLPETLSMRGVAYILFCARNKSQEALDKIMRGQRWQGGTDWEWTTEVVGKTGGKGGWERLEIVRIWRMTDS